MTQRPTFLTCNSSGKKSSPLILCTHMYGFPTGDTNSEKLVILKKKIELANVNISWYTTFTKINIKQQKA